MKKLLNKRSLFIIAFTALVIKAVILSIGMAESLVLLGILGSELVHKAIAHLAMENKAKLDYEKDKDKLTEDDKIELLTKRLSSLESKFGLQGLRK